LQARTRGAVRERSIWFTPDVTTPSPIAPSTAADAAGARAPFTVPPGVGGEVLDVPRVLGTHGEARGGYGPLLLVNTGIHGNEPAGVHAARHLLARLREHGTPLRGRLVLLAANRDALRAGRRYLERDLNRGWTEAGLRRLYACPPDHDGPEDHAQRALLSVFLRELDAARGAVSFLDLHTSSADGAPFTCLADTLTNRAWALSLPVPVILGLEEAIDGAVMEWFEERGIAALAVEGGKHEDERSARNLLDVICLSMHARGLWDERTAAACGFDLGVARRRLGESSAGTPRIVEIVKRHALRPGDGFRMRPGFQSFDRVTPSTVLADSAAGEIRPPSTGRVLLPLYQGQGDDGFFFARDVARFWLSVASWARILGLPRIVTWLPGVRRDPGHPHGVLVDRRLARWFVVEVFHLLGYRKQRWRAGAEVWSFRRRVTTRAASGSARRARFQERWRKLVAKVRGRLRR
jgi:predicted deacylase